MRTTDEIKKESIKIGGEKIIVILEEAKIGR